MVDPAPGSYPGGVFSWEGVRVCKQKEDSGFCVGMNDGGEAEGPNER